MTIKMLAKRLIEDEEQDVSSWEVISMDTRLFKIFTDRKELHDFLLEYAQFGWKLESIEKNTDAQGRCTSVIWLKI